MIRIEKIFNQILSGYLKFQYNGAYFKLAYPPIDCRYEADIIHDNILELAELNGLFDEEELLDFLYENDIWSDKKEKQLESLKKDIEEFKVKMYGLTLKTTEREVARKALRLAEKTATNLSKERHSYDYVSSMGAAKIAKENYLVLSSLQDNFGNYIFNNNIIDEPSDILMPLVSFYHKNRVLDKDIRVVARTDPWRTSWVLSKDVHQIFGKLVYNLTEEQRILCSFSKMYDNIYESPECPHESVISDDDLLDGWLIIQHRKRDKEQNTKVVEEKIGYNPKIKNADEVYVFADTQQDAKKIEDMNDIGAKVIKQQRMNAIKKAGGQINEEALPDMRQKFFQEAHKMTVDKLKGKS